VNTRTITILMAAILVGCTITSLPWMASLTNNEVLLGGVSLLLFPGMIVGMLVGRGSVHSTPQLTVGISNQQCISARAMPIRRRQCGRG
jgi:hypothetical protein